MRILRSPIILAAALALAPGAHAEQPLPLTPASAPSDQALRALVDNAWQRSPAAQTLLARQEETAAARSLADSWLAGAPTLGLSDRSDRWTGQRQQRESEISLSAPLVLPGQHGLRQQLAVRSSEELDARLAAARLAVAGEVRNRLWEAAAARDLLAEKQLRLKYLQQLASDIERRVRAGELARTDGLLAQQEALAASAELALARSQAADALSRFRLLTGAAAVPELAPEALAGAALDKHPRLRAAASGEQRARAALQLAKANGQPAPTVGIAMRRERSGPAAQAERSIGLAVQIPLGSQARNRPAETQAASELAGASAELAQTRSALALELEVAREALANAGEALAAATARAAALREHAALIDTAFGQGERPLSELLRAQALSHEADVAARRWRATLAQAHAQFNQALGISP